MTEAKVVLHKRKFELERAIVRYKEQEARLMNELKDCRNARIYRERLLQEIMDVYNTLVD